MSKDMTTYIKQLSAHLSSHDGEFLKRVYSTPESIYIERLRAIGFYNSETVMDAGCGFGQWSLQLAKLNSQVYSIDASRERIDIFKKILNYVNSHNVHAQCNPLEEIKYADNTFDAVFCYGVLFCTDWKSTLREFYRVMKKGAVLYLTANDIGWYVHLWKNMPNETHDYVPRLYVAQSFINTVQYNNAGTVPRYADVIIEKAELKDYLIGAGFRVSAVGPEGTLCVNNNERKPEPFFKGEYYGLEGVYEILAEKEIKVK